LQAILNYELANNIPPGWINHSISRSAPNGFWQKLERGEILLDSTYFAGFSNDLHNQDLWSTFYSTKARTINPSLPATIPSLPKVDAELLFWTMMEESRPFDPWMYPALLALKRSKKYILAALSNTVIFPPSHPYSDPPASLDIRQIFDVFVSSAHVGLRKPDPAIYELALKKVNEYARENGRGAVEAEDVLFFDDIGENLKAAKKAGFGTVKVNLGRTYEAVDELEKVTGLKLAGDHPRIPVEPKIPKEAKL
jgi:HAD superfamily hydrolase (TIGR01509 family)